MRILDAFADHCLDLAIRRWPAGLRDEYTAEWRAEMSAIATDPPLGSITRTVRRLRFAFSLATSPPVEDENGVPRGWRELVPAWGRTLWPALVLFGMGLFSTFMAIVTIVGGTFVADLVTGGSVSTPTAVWASAGVSLALLVATVALMGWLGTALGRRLPLMATPRTALGRVASALLPVVLVGVGMTLGARSVRSDFIAWYAVLLWALACAVVAVGVVFLARGGRSQIGRWLGFAGGLVLLDLIAVELGVRFASTPVRIHRPHDNTIEYMDRLAGSGGLDLSWSPLWFPLSLIQPFQSGIDDPAQQPLDETTAMVANGIGWTMTIFLVALVFTVAYSVRAATATRRVPVSVPASVRSAESRTIGVRARLVALSCTGAAMLVWAYTVAFTTSQVEPLESVPELMLWGYELRQAAILLGLLSLCLALNGSGLPLVYACIGGGVLVVADRFLGASPIPDPLAFGIAVALAIAVCTGIWWLTHALAGGGPHADSVRRGRIMIALVAAYAAPVLFLQATRPYSESGPATPVALPVGTAIVSASLAALGITAALSARKRPMSTMDAVLLVGAPVVFLAGVGLYTGTLDGYWLRYVAALSLPLGAIAFSIIRWDRPRRRILAGFLWPLAILSAIPLQVPFFDLGFYVSMIGSPVIDSPAVEMSRDGSLPLISGALICGIPLAVLATMRTVRRPPEPETVTIGELTTV